MFGVLLVIEVLEQAASDREANIALGIRPPVHYLSLRVSRVGCYWRHDFRSALPMKTILYLNLPKPTGGKMWDPEPNPVQ